jgi:hypothetical protein
MMGSTSGNDGIGFGIITISDDKSTIHVPEGKLAGVWPAKTIKGEPWKSHPRPRIWVSFSIPGINQTVRTVFVSLREDVLADPVFYRWPGGWKRGYQSKI